MKITLDIPDGIIAGFFIGTAWTWFLTTSRQSSLQTTP